MNLYDKYKHTEWHQLWADDEFAAVFYAKGKGYEVVTDNHRFVTRTLAKDLTEAFDLWNAAINEHLDASTTAKQNYINHIKQGAGL